MEEAQEELRSKRVKQSKGWGSSHSLTKICLWPLLPLYLRPWKVWCGPFRCWTFETKEQCFDFSLLYGQNRCLTKVEKKTCSSWISVNHYHSRSIKIDDMNCIVSLKKQRPQQPTASILQAVITYLCCFCLSSNAVTMALKLSCLQQEQKTFRTFCCDVQENFGRRRLKGCCRSFGLRILPLSDIWSSVSWCKAVSDCFPAMSQFRKGVSTLEL